MRSDDLIFDHNPRVKARLDAYPPAVRSKLEHLRSLIIETALKADDIFTLEETLKWGEPSFLTKMGSTIRIGWYPKTPGQYAMYFKCTSKLVPTFKAIFGDTFRYENNRAIVFGMDDPVPEEALKVCIKMALQYHKIKDKPLLGY
jgi:hypothetical protein